MLGDQILQFLKFFYYFYTIFENPCFLALFYYFFIIKNRDFQKSFKNSKKISKNVKFGLQTHFNIEITLNGLDSSFEAYPIGFRVSVI